MRRSSQMNSLLLAVLPLACASLACEREMPRPAPDGSAEALAATRAWPRPTENWLEDEDEAREESERQRWMESMHRAAPEVDWRAIEVQNGLREMERRNQLAQGPEQTLRYWTEVGSKNQAGRMHCAAIGPDGLTLYAGSAFGGVWRGTLAGTGWMPLGDNLYGGVHELSVLPGEHPGEPDVLLVTTDSGLVHVTRDSGLSWQVPAGLSTGGGVRGLAQLQDSARTLLILARQTGSGILALYGSSDYGRSFQVRWSGGASYSGSMWVPRKGAAAANTVYLVHQGRCYVSTNGGSSFTPLAQIVASSSGAVLTGSEAGAPTLYAAVNSGGWKLFRSDDAGASFAQVNTITDFWESLCASTLDASLVLYGGMEAHRSTNGGGSFAIVNGWGEYYSNPANKLHADIPGLYCFPAPANPALEKWYAGTDGGLYKSDNSGASFQNLSLSGLGVSQYYTTLTSRTSPNLILAGAQDQGYQRGTFVPSTGPGPTTGFTQLISGDYGHLTSWNGSHSLVYSTYPGFVLVQEGETNPQLLFPYLDFPSGSNHSWMPPIAADPLNASIFYFCGDKLTRYTRVSGATWSQALHSTQSFNVSGSSYLSAIAFAKTDPQRVYAATDAGRLYYSTNHGVQWTFAQSGGPNQHYFYGNTIAVHPSDPLEAAVGGSGYSNAGVLRTIDGGASWSPLTAGLPQTLVYSLAYSEDGTGDLYAGTEMGALRWNRSTGQWENIMSNQAPITTYWSVESLLQGAVMRFGTYGRGIWDYTRQPGGTWSGYGTGKLTSIGTLPDLSGFGSPSLSGAGFTLELREAVPSKSGIIISSVAPHNVPFQGGTLLVKPPITRGPPFVLDVFGYAAASIPIDLTMVGTTRYYQAWFRDPQHPDLTGVGLSDGVQVDFGY